MIAVKCNSKLIHEKKYVFDVIMRDFLGIKYECIFSDSFDNITLEFENDKELVIKSLFFEENDEDYLQSTSLPQVNYGRNIYIPENDIPIFYGNSLVETNQNRITCHIDIFGTCFFYLSRLEEVLGKELDNHERFAATSSLAYKHTFLDRPIVDEYVEMLWNMITKLDPEISRKKRTASNIITCDLDYPSDTIRHSFFQSFRQSIGDIVKRKNIGTFFSTWKKYIFFKLSIDQPDENLQNIYWMMDVNEKINSKVAFNFITERTSDMDRQTDFNSLTMRKLLKDIHKRGHEIGLHPGYMCFNDPDNFHGAANTLRKAMEEEGIVQNKIGGRMHYIRWDILKTPQQWENANFEYDSTLCFADKAGFRCGTSHDYPMFDFHTRTAMKLKQRPLITMECSIIMQKYENLGFSKQALERFKYFKNKCHKYNGNFVLLWHNNFFDHPDSKEFYKEIIQ